jgi:hypothetical protein
MRSIASDDGWRDPVADQAEREGLYLPLHASVAPEATVAALDAALARVPA